MTNQETIKTMKSMVCCHEATKDTVCNKVCVCANCEGYTTPQQEIDALKKAIELLEKEYKEPKTDFSNIDLNTLAMARVNGFYEEE